MTFDQLLGSARQRLRAASFSPSPREAALLLGWLCGLSEAQVIARGRAEVPTGVAAELEGLLRRRLLGEPVAYLLGEREFYGRPFWVGREVLIPRPETEHLVAAALVQPLPAKPWIVDLGTGSGCIAISLGLELNGSRVLAIDRSLGALRCAARNRRRHGCERTVALVQADWAAATALGRCDLLVSNPPYIDPALAAELSPEVSQFEPAAALFAEEAGLAAYRRILTAATSLRSGVRAVFEIGDGQLPDLERIVARSGLKLVEVRADYAGKARVVVLKRA